MANASTKRIAASNEQALRNLQLGLLVVNVSPSHLHYHTRHADEQSGTWILRFLISLISKRPFFPRIVPFILYLLSTSASIFVWRWFVTIGTPTRQGGDIKVGDDLNGKGVIELAWDLSVRSHWTRIRKLISRIYMTWICALGSALLGNKVWWLLLLVSPRPQ
jgi:hypothetical protein